MCVGNFSFGSQDSLGVSLFFLIRDPRRRAEVRKTLCPFRFSRPLRRVGHTPFCFHFHLSVLIGINIELFVF